MAPTTGRIVLVTNLSKVVNGKTEFPAIITAVHSDEVINCRVFEDSVDRPMWYTSVTHEGTAGSGYQGQTWRWPPREECDA